MKRITSLLICLLVGAGLGWYFGYTRPTAKNQRELLAQYRYVRDKFHMTDAEMADFGSHQQEYFAEMKRQDEMAAAIALAALEKLDQDDLEKAKWRLRTAISIYLLSWAQAGRELQSTATYYDVRSYERPSFKCDISKIGMRTMPNTH